MQKKTIQDKPSALDTNAYPARGRIFFLIFLFVFFVPFVVSAFFADADIGPVNFLRGG